MAMQTNHKQSIGARWENYQPSKSTLVWTCIGTAVAP